ncbi:hypothetical protein SDC9_167886 [bioreactor metagenome]|uniref:Lipocalin-like domain-containing protein n=1 Tax=bioreactor metagenome TaxID=1076179 RepID=A0A645G0Z1_9ZZZZ
MKTKILIGLNIMKKIICATAFFILILSVISCKENDNDKYISWANCAAIPNPEQAIIGKWVFQCYSSADGRYRTKYYSSYDEEVAETRYIKFYSDGTFDDNMHKEVNKRTYKIINDTIYSYIGDDILRVKYCFANGGNTLAIQAIQYGGITPAIGNKYNYEFTIYNRDK